MIPTQYLDAFKDSLHRGNYNLLLGSGISLDSTNASNLKLRSAGELRTDLCAKKGVSESTPLNRVFALLDQDEKAEVIESYSGCRPGKSLDRLPHYLWRRIFSFNIDDVLENLYSRHRAKQSLIALNYSDPFEPTPTRGEIVGVHLHGWVARPGEELVFSYPEYARVMRNMNPWMVMLSQIIATEPFIVAGTSLNEPDLEYYLSYRSSVAPRKISGPSILVEPFPDAVTESDCKRFNLLLVKATFAEFLSWLHQTYPHVPTVSDLVVPAVGDIFSPRVAPNNLVKFFSDFRLIQAQEKPRPTLPSPFLYGREPSQGDLDAHLDIMRSDVVRVTNNVSRMLNNKSRDVCPMLLVVDEAGSGKSSIVTRVGHDMASRGQIVFQVTTMSKIDLDAAHACLAELKYPAVIIVDGMADHAEQIASLIMDQVGDSNIVVLGAERQYRMEYLKIALSEIGWDSTNVDPLTHQELLELIELYRGYGLIGNPQAVAQPNSFADMLSTDTVAVACCRILNDFKPLDRIVDSLWDATSNDLQFAYLCAALADHCHSSGIRYSILRSVCGHSFSIDDILTTHVPLALVESSSDPDFLVPLNRLYADIILKRSIIRQKSLLFSVFTSLAKGLAPYVNRAAIRMRTPDARTAGRLLDADKVVKPFLGEKAQDLYMECKPEWAWNSRYWEQRALLISDIDIETALQYARHAVAIERHPYTLTTQGKILFKKMTKVSASEKYAIFPEAFSSLKSAIEMEGRWSKITVHPFASLLSGVCAYVSSGCLISLAEKKELERLCDQADRSFGRDRQIAELLDKVAGLVSFE